MSHTITLFLGGLFLANGIPHFVQGISGRDFHNPFLHRFVPVVPSPLFNVIWGLLNFCLAMALLDHAEIITLHLDRDYLAMAMGFVVAAVGLSILFDRPIKPDL